MDVDLAGITVDLGDFTACHDITLAFPTGTVTGIVGPNGAGKTSLLRCLYRALRPAHGTIAISGDDLWSLNAPEAARRVAAVIQEQPAGFELLVRDIVALGRIPHRTLWQRLADDDQRIIDDALCRVEIDHLAARNLAELSGGERQRVIIARALAQQASVLVLDEPTNHLDIRHQLEILELVTGLGVTVIAALHDLTLADGYCDQAVVMRNGKVVTAGPPAETLTPETIRDVFGVATEIVTVSSGQRSFVFTRPGSGRGIDADPRPRPCPTGAGFP